ncbi:hypothetical protein B0J14DRAFT_490548 [Halenospora varia]|nr:hypothetical protein B0J14DRAFT_490548 [Halenospora varia]
MSRFFPQAQYEEDQTLSHTILYTHVTTRFIQAGALVGSGISASAYLLRRFNVLLKPSLTPTTYASTLLRAGGTGGMVGVGLGIAATTGRMWGREEIEWQERSWRLLANRGQVECDDWTYSGMVGGAVAGGMRKGALPAWRRMVGGAGLGSVVGMVGYMGWRYGVNGGRRESVI